MTTSDFAERVAGIAALAEPLRRDLYAYVVGQPGPVSRDQAAEGVGVPRHTVKFHLDKLVEEGLLETEFKRLSGRRGPGAGRPTKLYKRSGRQLSVNVPERRYDLAAELFAGAIETANREQSDVAAALKARVTGLGRSLGAKIPAHDGSGPGRAATLASICDVLAEVGYEPRQESGTVTLANCPFHNLARQHVDLVCGMNLDLISALVAEAGDSGLEVRLDPSETRCCVLLHAGQESSSKSRSGTGPGAP